MKTNDREIAIPDILMNPLPWKVERDERITDRAGCLVYQDKDSTPDTLHFVAVAANYHERMADLVQRLATAGFQVAELTDIADDAVALWAEYRKEVQP